ncbi:alpha/beta hydrolase [Sphingomonas sp.]|uniref:alpha/beta hydrolase n=1 Tax=Sphingomonas sp. TaxID=28214 RepID=UPI001B11A060|nr:alpha/beta hydrolase [Sphingomonas sp.]MBO9711325.1 alpha/beta hydrolase [Sphingomonas sp.]
MRGPALALALLALAGCGQSGKDPAPVSTASAGAELVTLRAVDGVKVFGAFVPARDKPRALVLLFHQTGSSKTEYADIQLRLANAGYSSLAIDQRSGGGMYGPNETVAELGHEGSYLEAKRDLEAALAWAQGKRLPVVLWGSSYSASLVFLVAAEHAGKVAALLAFSPDEYFDGRPPVKPAAAKLAIPVFVTSAEDPKEIAAARALLDAVPAKAKVQFVPAKGGVHGSSTLRSDRNPQGAGLVWEAVLEFLKKAVE